jgi:hypothetical protein
MNSIDWNSIAVFCSDGARIAWDCAAILETLNRGQREKVKFNRLGLDKVSVFRDE